MKYWIFLPILIMLTVSGCFHDKVGESLDVADRLLDTNPDSALAVIRAIDSSTLVKEEHHARHSLLLTMALLKTDPSSASDSLFSPACAYYAKKSEPTRETMLAHFARAALHNMHDSVSWAIIEYDIAARSADLLGDHLYSGLSCLNQAAIYCNLFDFSFDKAILDKAERQLADLPYDSYIINYHIVKGIYEEGHGRYDSGLNEYTKALKLSESIGDSIKSRSIKADIASNYIMRDSVESGIRSFNELIKSGYAPNEQQIFIYSLGMMEMGDNSLAEMLLSHLENNISNLSKGRKYYLLSKISRARGDKEMAIAYNDSVSVYCNKLHTDLSYRSHNKDIVQGIKNNNISTSIQSDRERDGRIQWMATSAVIFVFSLIVIYFLYRLRGKMKRQQRESENAIALMLEDFEELRKQKTSLSLQLSELKKWKEEMLAKEHELENAITASTRIIELQNQISKRLETMKENFMAYHRSIAARFNHLPNGSARVIKNFEKEREKVFDDYKESGFQKELAKDMDLLLDGIVAYMRNDLKFTDDLVLTAMLGICGFNYQSIALILDISSKNASVRLSRIKKGFERNKEKDAQNHIRYLPFGRS